MSYQDANVLGVNLTFIGRVQSAMLSAAISIFNEGIAVNNHAPRVQLIHNMLASPTQITNFANMFSLAVATDATVLGDATQANTVPLTTSNIQTQQALITDAHISSAVAAQFNAFALNIVA